MHQNGHFANPADPSLTHEHNMSRFSQRELPFSDPRSEKELATAILHFVLLPENDFTDIRGRRIHRPAKTLASVSLDETSQAIRQFRHALFTVSRGESEPLTRRGIEGAALALDELATLYDKYATEARRRAEIEFIDSRNGPVGRHTAEIDADINDAENYKIVATRLRSDPELRRLVQALANKLHISLGTNKREL